MKKLTIILCLFAWMNLIGQTTMVKIILVDKDTQEPLSLNGVEVLVEGQTQNFPSDINWDLHVRVDKLPATVEIKKYGYQTARKKIERKVDGSIRIALKYGKDEPKSKLDGSPRTRKDAPTPWDNFSLKDLVNTGKFSLDRMIMYNAPSVNATQQPISDATAHFDAVDIRGLGSSRVLVLINGKRKNGSSHLNVQDAPNKSEVGIDWKSIPYSAIDRIEVYRDGASTRYGSDAIAGIINIILKEEDLTQVDLFTGITHEKDGLLYGANFNTGHQFGTAGGVYITGSFTQQDETNRVKPVTKDAFFNNESDWVKNNPTLGMKIGIPQTTNINLMYNASYNLSEYLEVYGFGSINYRDGLSYALYRPPYWVEDEYNIFHQEGAVDNGFLPTFEIAVQDKFNVIGINGKKNDWEYDLSLNTGVHTSDYNIGNTMNLDLEQRSPTTFFAGAYQFQTNTVDITARRTFSEKLNLEFGGQFRTENFKSLAGEEASYIGKGAISFPGLQPANVVDKTRFNAGGFLDIEWIPKDELLLSAAIRGERYSDFGTNISWKGSVRYMPTEQAVIRASASTAFRAPALHQYYLSNIQTNISNNTVSNQGTFNHESPILRELGVEPLKEETSRNYSIGTYIELGKKAVLSVDGYLIDIKDRVAFSGDVNRSSPLLAPILEEFDIQGLKFFTNAIDTRTKGVDIVFKYEGEIGATGILNVHVGGNIAKHEIIGAVKVPELFVKGDIELLNRKEKALITKARPTSKLLANVNYKVGKYTLHLNSNRFGRVTWQHPEDAAKDQVFNSKYVVDAILNYSIGKKGEVGNISFAINNLFNTYMDPVDPKEDALTNLGGRFYYPWQSNQFDFLGRSFYLKFTYNLSN